MVSTETEFNDVYEIFCRYDDVCNYFDGTLQQLNNKKEIEIEDELREVIEFALEFVELEDYFNILSGGVNELWKTFFNGTNTTIPDEIEIFNEINIMNSSTISIEDDMIKINGLGKIDLGAVAKGYATKKVGEYLKQNKIDTYLVNAGGSNLLLGYKNQDESYGVGIQYIENYEFAKVLYVNNKSVVTSSIEYLSTTIDDKFYSHIIDPTTGYSNDFYDSITVIGDCAATLDILSTSMFNMDIDKIREISLHYGVDVVVIKGANILFESEGVRMYEKISN